MSTKYGNDICLAIIDVQKGFLNRHTMHIPGLVENLQKDYSTIVVSRFVNAEDSSFRSFMKWQRFDNMSSERDLAFRPKDDAFVFEKPTYTIWISAVRSFFYKHAVREVHLVGIDTDVCVLVSAVDLFQNNIRPVVRAKYCASHGGPEYDDAALLIMQRLIGKDQIELDFERAVRKG